MSKILSGSATKTLLSLLKPLRADAQSMRKLVVLSPALLMILLSGCADYAVSVNDNTIYSPPAPLGARELADDQLVACLQATVKEKQLTRPEQLVQLLCPASDVQSLTGIGEFQGLKQIDLSHNPIQELTPLTTLDRLEQINLHATGLKTAAPLATLPSLRLVILTGNPSLDCDSAQALSAEEVRLPEHCAQAE